MEWVKLKSKNIRSVLYNAETETLIIKFVGKGKVEHQRITLLMYSNLIETTDPEFYYRYYIEPGRISTGRRTLILRFLSRSIAITGSIIILTFPVELLGMVRL